ncbi:MAG: glycerol-3-phosphate 1-O-acyltransferase PlsY [Myxococcota bacterium]
MLENPAVGIAFVVGGYLSGSVSFAILFARRAGVDIREEGSGNPGATNVGRVLGKRTGRVVLLLDALKGAIPVLAARFALGADGPTTEGPWNAHAVVAATAVAATLGHVAPLFHGFRGGKGAATAAGVILASVPLAGVVATVTYVVLKKVFRTASVGSIGGAFVGAAVIPFLATDRAYIIMGAAIFVLVLLRHHENIRRLWTRKEPES